MSGKPSFVGEKLEPAAGSFDPAAMSRGEPALPAAFRWRGETLAVEAVERTWRSTRTDRGDVYLARHWFEIACRDGRRAVVYFERHARPGAARWWLYTLDEAP